MLSDRYRHFSRSDFKHVIHLFTRNSSGPCVSVSLGRVVKHFPNDDFSVRIQNHCRCLKQSAWLFRNIFYTTPIQQNIGNLSSECKCYLLRRLCLKCFNTSNSRFCVRRVTHSRAFCKQGLSRINLSRTFLFQLFTVDSRRFFLTSPLSGVILVGSCLLLRSSTAS